jgi:putative MFS transporter
MTENPAPTEGLTSYHRWLFVFLGVAGFFEGYDSFALAQILPFLRQKTEMDLTKPESGILLGVINIGFILAYLLVRNADRWGRRRILTITIVGYTVCTVLTGLSPNVYFFAIAQLAARAFLAAEWAVGTVYAAEEFPAARRGTVIGIIHGVNAFGAVVCAGVAPLLCKTHFGWRSVYFVGVVPLIFMAVARRSLRETRRFEERVAPAVAPSLTRILAPAWRGRMLTLAAIWGLTYASTSCSVTFYKDFAITERGLSDETVGASIAMAAILAVPLAFGAGKLIDRIGRRRGAIVIYALTTLGTLGAYNLGPRAFVVASLIASIVGITGVGVVMAAYTAELFPTDLRGDAFAWSNNLLGRLTLLVAPPLVGLAAERYGWGLAVSFTAICPALALALILSLLPETSGRELEETSRMAA